MKKKKKRKRRKRKIPSPFAILSSYSKGEFGCAKTLLKVKRDG